MVATGRLVDRSFQESQIAELAELAQLETRIKSIGKLEMTVCGNKQRRGRLVVASNSELCVNMFAL